MAAAAENFEKIVARSDTDFYYPLDAQLEGVEPDEALARLAAAQVRCQYSKGRSIGFLRKSKKDPMTESQCLTCSNMLKMTRVLCRS
jgi:hypothetical protein